VRGSGAAFLWQNRLDRTGQNAEAKLWRGLGLLLMWMRVWVGVGVWVWVWVMLAVLTLLHYG
jgi:hypothetical protein